MIKNPTELFTDGWTAYEKVLQHNYLFHQEIYSDIKQYMDNQNLKNSLNILEAGCGDASQTIKLFKECNVQYYYGIDLSSFALEIAKKNLEYFKCEVNLKCNDILDGMSQISRQFDIIFTSFVIHHLPKEAKQRFFDLAKEKLTDQGMLIYVDVMKDHEKQDRTTYINDYLGFAKQHWNQLNEKEMEAVYEHVSQYDFPESLETNILLAKNSGFQKHLKVSHHTWHQAIIFNR